MISFNVELNSSPIKGSNEHNLLLRITVQRKHARIALRYSVVSSAFNPKAKIGKNIRASYPDHAKINAHIIQQVEIAKDVITELENEHKLITAKGIRAKMHEPRSHDFLQFADQFIEEFKSNHRIGSYKKYKSVLKSIKDFNVSPTLAFEEIDSTFLNKYQTHLLNDGKKLTTIQGYLAKIRAIFNIAIDKGVLELGSNPFNTFRLKHGRPNKDRLTLEEIIKIENLELPEGSLIWHVRNAFLFSFYNAGIRISDILMMTWDNIKEDRLVYTMYKTHQSHAMKLKEKPLAILEKYKGKEESFIFPFLADRFDYSDPMFLHNQIGSKTALINKYLKQIAIKAEISKNITTHTARHTFADLARQKTDNIYNLSKTLGHSSLKVTEAYLSSFDEKAVDDTLDSMFN